MQQQMDRLGPEHEPAVERLAELREALVRLEDCQLSEGTYFRAALARQSSADAGNHSVSQHPASGRLDSFYVSLEDRFRGERSQIRKHCEVYLPDVMNAGAGIARRPVLDLGCGRGEWLELLREKNFTASGVDLNASMLADCQGRQLEVVRADALQHLRSLPDDSLGAVTGFHIIEHLPIETLLDLFAETRRVLAPGGVAIFESPNCKNLLVGACHFYIDPTHRNPIFPETAELMLGLHGFERIEIRYLAPDEGSPFKRDTPESAFLHDRLFGPQDFGVIAYKRATE